MSLDGVHLTGEHPLGEDVLRRRLGVKGGDRLTIWQLQDRAERAREHLVRVTDIIGRKIPTLCRQPIVVHRPDQRRDKHEQADAPVRGHGGSREFGWGLRMHARPEGRAGFAANEKMNAPARRQSKLAMLNLNPAVELTTHSH